MQAAAQSATLRTLRTALKATPGSVYPAACSLLAAARRHQQVFHAGFGKAARALKAVYAFAAWRHRRRDNRCGCAPAPTGAHLGGQIASVSAFVCCRISGACTAMARDPAPASAPAAAASVGARSGTWNNRFAPRPPPGDRAGVARPARRQVAKIRLRPGTKVLGNSLSPSARRPGFKMGGVGQRIAAQGVKGVDGQQMLAHASVGGNVAAASSIAAALAGRVTVDGRAKAAQRPNTGRWSSLVRPTAPAHRMVGSRHHWQGPINSRCALHDGGLPALGDRLTWRKRLLASKAGSIRKIRDKGHDGALRAWGDSPGWGGRRQAHGVLSGHKKPRDRRGFCTRQGNYHGAVRR